MDFDNMISGKSVALIGPALYLTDSGYGDEIDSNDVVIRLNRGIELVNKHSQDIGTRTDILYSCLIEKPANAGKLDIELMDDLGIKMIVAPPHSDFVGVAHQTKFHQLVNYSKISNIAKEIPVRIIDHVFHTELAKEVSCKPNTGFLAIFDLLRYKPKSLSIYGFSFYLDGFITASDRDWET